MCLRLIYLIVVGVVSWLRPAGKEASWKDAEIMLLRHQLGVFQRQQVRKPKLSWRPVIDRDGQAGILASLSVSASG